MNNYTIISIEGNIGSGKSTLLHNLKEKYANNSQIIFLKEPVDDWDNIRDEYGQTMLQKFYANQDKYSFAFQMMAYISRLKILKDAVDNIKNKSGYYIIITERSLYTDKHVFAKMLFNQNHIEDVCYQIYNNWFDLFAKDYNIKEIIYVKTNPEICYNRVHKRNRNGEETIPLEYLNECHNYHETFLEEMKLTNKLLLDGNIDIYECPNELNNWLNQIEKMLFIDL